MVASQAIAKADGGGGVRGAAVDGSMGGAYRWRLPAVTARSPGCSKAQDNQAKDDAVVLAR